MIFQTSERWPIDEQSVVSLTHYDCVTTLCMEDVRTEDNGRHLMVHLSDAGDAGGREGGFGMSTDNDVECQMTALLTVARKPFSTLRSL